MYRGTFTALVTPFRNGSIDEDAFRKLVDAQFENGVTGIVPVGTTGESPTLSYEEHKAVIRLAVESAKGRGPVIGGTGANSTDEAIELTASAEAAGCEAVLQVAPYYNKPSPEGLFQHFKAVADSTKCRIILYSVPGRCGIEIPVETAVRLAEACPNVVSIKEASGSVERVNQLVAALPDGFTVLSGDDSMTLPFISVGATGVISVASNLIPRAMSDLVNAALADDLPSARRQHRQLYPLLSAFLKLDSNPVPIKAAMALKGLIGGDLRLPMVPMAQAKQEELRAVLDRLGI
ncbi:MAG: 4-hydroxy-tetrahydrodipicolinate synthase [Verrucomicrobiaceae bacterium]|nr:MAG: 4-hydroxy-tetrahydrodipicolinate synthase [Verrucomicrobiaceae bacterium]